MEDCPSPSSSCNIYMIPSDIPASTIPGKEGVFYNKLVIMV